MGCIPDVFMGFVVNLRQEASSAFTITRALEAGRFLFSIESQAVIASMASTTDPGEKQKKWPFSHFLN
jgi:hypothetical protein